MANGYRQVDEDGVLGRVYDQAENGLRVVMSAPVSLSGDMAIDLDALGGDSVAVKNPTNGNTLGVNADGSINVAGVVSGNVDIPPPTDFRSKTVQVSGTSTAITFDGFTITGITIKALINNPGDIRIGKSDVSTTAEDYYLLSPGESLNLPLAASSEPVYYVTDPSEPAGTYKITILAVN